MKFAVTALILDEEATAHSFGVPHFVGVTRKNDDRDWGLPGGKVEDEETLESAIVRELQEETGLTLHRLNPIFCGLEISYNVTTFFGILGYDALGTLGTEENILVNVVSPYELLAGSFGDYNLRLLTSKYPQYQNSMRAFCTYIQYLQSGHDKVYVTSQFSRPNKLTLHISGVRPHHLEATKLGIHMLDDAFTIEGLDLSLNIS